MKKFILLTVILLASVLSAGIPMHDHYMGPTEQEVKRETMVKISKKLKDKKIPLSLLPFFDAIAEQEDWGHIGYHGANQGYRIYQDIIRMTIEELLNIPIREDFQFLRVPGDKDLNIPTLEEFFGYWGKHIDNRNDTRAKQLLSLNFGIYSNYDTKGSCSVSLFVKDQSRTRVDYIGQLRPFYHELGIDTKKLEALFTIGRKWLDEDGGILLQISENSHLTDPHQEAYNFADQQCYPAKRGGYVYGKYPISDHYQRIMTNLYVNGDLDRAPQLRLILDNQYTLNPNSHLIVRKWDLYDRETIEAYEHELRECIKKLKPDPIKVKFYRDDLLNIWN